MTLTTEEQDALIEKNLMYARKLAIRRDYTTPGSVLREDLEAAANLGLVQAARNYDPDKGTKFTTHAYTRINGAMNDYLRECDHVPAKERAKQKEDGHFIGDLFKFTELSTFSDEGVEERFDPSDYREDEPDHAAIRNELISKVEAALPPHLWELYIERHMEGKSAIQIAEEKGVSRQAITKRLAEAQEIITEVIGDDRDDQ